MAAIKEVRPRKIMFFKCIRDKILLFCHLRTCSPYLASLRWIVWGSGSASPQPEPFFPKSIFHCSIVKLTNTHCCVMESTIYTINTKKEVDIFVLSHCWPFPPWDNFQQSPYSEGQSQSTYRKIELKICDRKGFSGNLIQKNAPSAKSQNRNCHYQVNNHKWHSIALFLLIEQIGNVESGIVGTAVLQVNQPDSAGIRHHLYGRLLGKAWYSVTWCNWSEVWIGGKNDWLLNFS